MFISVISPVYGAKSLLSELVSQIENALQQIHGEYEIILVEDCSPDGSWEVLRELAKANPRVKAVRLSRNFGQQNALNAGFDIAKGEWIVTLDCDLQDDPAYISKMLDRAHEGFDVVFASRQNRQDGWLKKTGSYLFYKLLGYLSETEQDHSIANYVLYHRKVVVAMSKVGDYYRYYPMLNKWVGFKTTKLQIPHADRKDQVKSSYSLKKRIRLAYNTIVSFSDKPLRLILKFGFLLSLLSFVVAMVLVVNYFANGVTVSGWLSIFLSVWFLSGIILMTLGIIGLYVGRSFETLKRRPTYLIDETINLDRP